MAQGDHEDAPASGVVPFYGSVKTKTVLIAGGAGFIGSHLCRRLARRGHRVICLDNTQTGFRDNIASLEALPNFRFIKHDVTQPIHIDGPIDEIYNMACAASPEKYQSNPIHTFKTNIWGALNLLDLAHSKKARILLASTSEVYGDPKVSPQAETYFGNTNTFGPRSCYDEGKRGAETLFRDYHHQHGVDIRVARIFNTYGPQMALDDGRVVSNLIVQALTGADLVIYGDGTQTRSFCYIDDLIDGLVRLMDHPDPLPFPVNLGNPFEITVNELAARILRCTGSTAGLRYQPLPVDDPTRRCPDIARARTLLGWTPGIPLDEGLTLTARYMRRALQKRQFQTARLS